MMIYSADARSPKRITNHVPDPSLTSARHPNDISFAGGCHKPPIYFLFMQTPDILASN